MRRQRYLLLREHLVVFLLVFLVELDRNLHDCFVLGQEESQPDSLVLKSQTFNSNDGGWEELSSSLVQVRAPFKESDINVLKWKEIWCRSLIFLVLYLPGC